MTHDDASPDGEALYQDFDYTAFWKEPGRANLDVLEHWVVSKLLPARGRRVLDAGCAHGRMASSYIGRFDESVLMDPAWSQLEAARDRVGPRGTFVAADLLALPFAPGAFDAVITVRVLHHIQDWMPVFSAVREALAEGGVWVFNISNKRNLKRIARYALARRGGSPFEEGFEQYGDLSYGCHPGDADRLMRNAGLTPVAWRGVGVMDKVASRAGSLARLVPKGRSLSYPLGWVRVAPSEFCAARGGDAVAPSEVSVELFRCPQCGSALSSNEAGHACASCGRVYPLRDGIHDFRV